MLLRLTWFRKPRSRRASYRPRYNPAIERLEDRALLSATWTQLNGNAQHTGDTTAVAQPIDHVLYSVPLDLEPWGAVHYGDPVFTSGNTVIVPIKVTWSAQDQNAQNFFVEGLNTVTGQVLWTSVPTGTITGASNSGPIVITSPNNGLQTGDSVTIGGVQGDTAANGTFTVTYINANEFSLDGTTGNGAYSGGGTWVSNTGNASFIEPTYSWIPPFQPVYDAVTNRVYFPGPGGTIDYIANPDTPGTPTVVQEAFFGNSNYLANESAYNSSIYINTGLTVDNSGNVYFGFTETGTNPSGINDGGVVRISPTGAATYTLAYSAVGQTNDGNWNPAMGPSPAVSNDGSTVYFGMNDSGYSLNGNEYDSYLVGFNSTTLAPEYSVQLLDPSSGQGAGLIDESTAGPMVAPDGTVYQGVFGNPYNGSRGYLLHYSADLSTEFTPGAFGWDDTPSIVPTSMVPSYTGSSSYLILCKYNDYANADFGGPNSGDYGGNGVNEIAVLDPYSSVPDPNNDPNPNIQVMATVEAFASPSPDLDAVNAGDPDAVREWCTNGTVVDPATDSVFINNEDGYTYEWNLGTDTITNAVEITTGVGVPYTPTAVAPNGEVFSDNGGTLFAEGGYSNDSITTTSSANPAVVGNPITFTTALASTDGGPVPTGSVTFSYTEGASNPFNSTPITIDTVGVNAQGVASVQVSGWVAAHYHVVASYSGDGNYSAGQTTLVQPVLETATTTVSASGNPIGQGDGVTFTATVAPNGSSFVPIGTVTFMDGNSVLGTASLNNLDNEAYPSSDNTATLNVGSLPGGTDAITAVYNGDLNFTGGTSAIFDEYVPAVANPGTQNSAVGDTVSLQVDASGLAPGDTWTYSAIGLPSGLTINSSTGLITGMITGSADTYSATVTASDGQGDNPSQNFTWNVSALSVTNPGTQNSAVGDTVSLQVADSGLPSGDSWSYSASGLPSGLSISSSTGLITGTITGSANTYSASVTANDGEGASATQDFTWNVSALSVTNPGTQNNAVGDTVSVQVQDSGLPSGDSWTYSASGLPSGLSISSSTGLITGTITGSANTYSASVTASDGEGASATQNFTWNVSALSVTNPGTQNSAPGASVSLQIHAGGLPSGDSWTYSATSLPAGLSINVHTGLITGTITGAPQTYSATVTAADGNGASASQTFNWNVGPTTTTLTSSVDPSDYGQKVTFTATVAAVVTGSGKPTGSVEFVYGSKVLSTVTLTSADKATYTTSAFTLPEGSDAITAVYLGSTKFEGSTSSIFTQTVNEDPTTTTVKSSAATAVVGQSVTLTATVTSNNPGSGTPTGTVTFFDGNTPLGPGTLNSSGKATFVSSGLPLGSNSITVTYNSDGNDQTSSSGKLTETINPAATKTVVSTSGSPSTFGQSVTFTATVTVKNPGSGLPFGKVEFKDGSAVIGSGTLNGSGHATYSTTMLAVGTHSITAVFEGDADFTTSTSSAITQRVTKGTSSAAVSSSQSSVAPNAPVTFTATVVPASPGGVTPTGTVTFYSGSTVLGIETLDGNGEAKLTFSWKNAGSYKIKAVYSGDSNFASITSSVMTETVT
jgi:Bacterial Ig-like domain (group 3)/Putative Ig domain/Ubiquitin-activating enzyme E1 FCCH domain